jgi:VIT family
VVSDTRTGEDARADQPATALGRIRRSFVVSVGSIAFGMEDGTVSIFGLVFGVAASAPDSHAVFLAGETGAVAAAVSMMAGTFLDVESSNDQTSARLAEERARFDANRRQEDQAIHGRLVSAGFSDSDADTVIGIVRKHPEAGLRSQRPSTWGLTRRPSRVPWFSRRGCSSPTYSRPSCQSSPSPSSP